MYSHNLIFVFFVTLKDKISYASLLNLIDFCKCVGSLSIDRYIFLSANHL